MSNYLYVPSILINLISVTFSGKCSYTLIIKRGQLFICFEIIVDGLYVITSELYYVNNYVNNYVLESNPKSFTIKEKDSFD